MPTDIQSKIDALWVFENLLADTVMDTLNGQHYRVRITPTGSPEAKFQMQNTPRRMLERRQQINDAITALAVCGVDCPPSWASTEYVPEARVFVEDRSEWLEVTCPPPAPIKAVAMEVWSMRTKLIRARQADERAALAKTLPSNGASDVLLAMEADGRDMSRTAAMDAAHKNKTRDAAMFDELVERELVEPVGKKWRVSDSGKEVIKRIKAPGN